MSEALRDRRSFADAVDGLYNMLVKNCVGIQQSRGQGDQVQGIQRRAHFSGQRPGPGTRAASHLSNITMAAAARDAMRAMMDDLLGSNRCGCADRNMVPTVFFSLTLSTRH